jgi:hypothetical protein
MATQIVRPFGTSEAIDIHSALRSYTDWGSRQMFLETKIAGGEVVYSAPDSPITISGK